MASKDGKDDGDEVVAFSFTSVELVDSDDGPVFGVVVVLTPLSPIAYFIFVARTINARHDVTKRTKDNR